MAKKIIFIFIFILFFANGVKAGAESAEYQFVIEENGNVVVGLTLEGEGIAEIPIQTDASDIQIEGGSYTLDENILRMTFENDRAVILYDTALLTEKIGEEWRFSVPLVVIGNNIVRVAMPKSVIISDIEPEAEIESNGLLKLRWLNVENIEVRYRFLFTQSEDFRGILTALFALLTALLTGMFFYLKRKKKLSGRKEQIMQTLSDNEKKVVLILFEFKKEIKRSALEKKAELAKSSLAATLNNLERKKIVDIDKTYSTHLVKLRDWFLRL